MNDIDFPAWIATSPALAMAAVLGRSLQQTYCPAQHEFTIGFRAAEDSAGGGPSRRRFNDEHRRAKLLISAAKGDLERASSTSSSSENTDTDGDSDDAYAEFAAKAFPRRRRSGRGTLKGGAGKAQADDDDGDNEFYSVASSSADSEYDPMERPHLQKTRTGNGGPHPPRGYHDGGGFALVSLAAGGAQLSRPTHAAAGAPTPAPPMVDILHDGRVQRLLRLSCINDFCSSGGEATDGRPQLSLQQQQGRRRSISGKQATGIVALFALAVECRALPSDVTKGFYTECSSLFTTFLALLRDGIDFCEGVDVEGFTAALVACGLKMRSEGEEEGEPGMGISGSGAKANGSSSTTTPRSRNVGLSGFDPRMIDAAIVECIPEDIDACASSVIALGTLQGLACTHSRKPVYLSPPLANHLHSLTDAFAVSPNRRELAYKKLLSLLLEAMSCSLMVDYERTNNWITAIIQESYVVRGLFQKEVLHARVVAATLTLLIRQYQEMATEYAAACGNVEGMPDFSEGDRLIELVWRALQDALQGWSGNSTAGSATAAAADGSAEVTAPTKPQTLYGANLRVVVGSMLRMELERLRCFHVITGASTAYREKLLSVYASSDAGRLPAPTSSASAAATPVAAPPLLSRGLPERGKKTRSNNKKKGDGGYALYFPSDEEEVLRVKIMSNIVRFLLLPTSVLNVLPPGEATAALRSDIIAQCSQVLTIVSATEFAPGGAAHQAMDGAQNGGSLPATPHARGAAHNNNNNNSDGNHHHHHETDTSSSSATNQRVQFSNGYYRAVESIAHELIRVLVKVDVVVEGGGGNGSTSKDRRGILANTVINAVEGATAAAEACLQSLCASDTHIRSFAVSEVTDAVVRISGSADDDVRRARATFATSDTAQAANLAPCFDILGSIVVPRQYTLARDAPRGELPRYAQLLCDTYTDSLRHCLRRGGGEASPPAAPVPTAVMRVAAEAYWRLVTRVHERLCAIAADAVRLSHLHRHLARSGRAAGLTRAARRAAAQERARYVRLLNAENISIRQLVLAAIRCMLGVAWPGSGTLYQQPNSNNSNNKDGASGATASAWSGERKPSPSTEPNAMAATVISCIGPFLKPLSLLLALSTLFPIRSLRNKGLAAHAEHARYLTLDDYREHYLLYYYYRPTTKTDEGEQVSANTVEDADALLDSSESRHYLTEFRSLWLLLTYYGFSCEALAVASVKRKHLATATLFYAGDRHLTEEQATVIRHIAASAAPLLQMRSSDMHQSVADIASLERYMGRKPPAGCAGEGGGRGAGSVKKQLQHTMRRICGGASHWEKMTAEELFLLRSLLDLEMLRASSGSIANLTLYLHFEVREFVASPAIKHVIQHVVSAVCALYLDTLKTFLPKTTYQLVSKDIHQLVLLLSFSLASVRGAATTVLEMIIDAFPVFAAYASGLQLLWAVINMLESGTAAQVEGFCRRLHFNAVPAVAADATSDGRREQVQALVALAERWADTARRSAPLVLFQAAAKFVVGQSVMGAAGVPSGAGNNDNERKGKGGGGGGGGVLSASQLSGSRLAIKAAAEQTTTAEGALDGQFATTGVLAIGATSAPNYAQSLIKYSNAQGQVLSAVRVSAFAAVEQMIVDLLHTTTHNSIQSSPYRPALTHTVRYDEDGSLEEDNHHRGGGGNSVSRLYESDSLMCSSVALLSTGFTTPSGTMELLRYITQGPIRVFDAEHIAAAVDCWSWLLANDRERFMVPLLEHLAEGLQWTAAQGIGLFDAVRPSQNAEVQTGEGHGSDNNSSSSNSSDGSASNGFANNQPEARRARLQRLYPDDYGCRSPHRLLFAFLADTYADPGSPWSLDPDVLLVLYSLSSSMVQYPSRLSLKDSSFSETMRLAVLVGYVCRHLHMTNTRRQKSGEMVVVPYTSIATLRQRWYACLLQWFRKSPPSWYYAGNPSLALGEIAVLEALVRLLRDEESLLSRAALGFIDFSVGVAKDAGGGANGGAEPLVNIWGVASVVRERVEVIREGVANGEKGSREAAMNRLIKQEQLRLKELLRLMRTLVQHELVRLRVWQTPRRTLLISDPLSELGNSDWAELVDAAAHHDPAVMVAMTSRFPGYPAVHKACVRHVVQAPERFASVPEAVDLYITREVLDAGAPKLFLFTNCTIIQALRYLDSGYAKYPQVSSYAIRSLLSQRSEYLIFYLPQLLQVLATDSSGRIQDFLLRMSHKSLMFCHQLLWCLQTEGEGSNALGRKCKALETKITEAFDSAQRDFYKGEFDYTKTVSSLSGELMSLEKPQRKPKLRLRLQDAEFHDPIRQSHLYLPTDPEYRIVGVIPRTAGAMQSAAKCPILVQFQCVRRDSEDTRTPAAIEAQSGDGDGDGDDDAQPPPHVVKACIFKMGDDCRQDQISLQLIGLMKRILDAAGVPSYLYPYRVVTTGQDSGIIEVVPKSMSRNEIGKLVESNLAEFYVQTFGHPESVRFHRARDNFVKSVASYSVVSFILNIKDRHNGNIMIDNEGHLVHIDFGFLFDTSPGGDMNFESSPFKLTTEMIQLIGKNVGGSSNLRSKSLAKALVDEESYVYFKTLVNRCYLAVRQYAREICVLVELMLRSGLPCFKPKQTIANLAKRLAVGRTEIEAANYMRERIHESRQNYRTVLYDIYQQVAEGIER